MPLADSLHLSNDLESGATSRNCTPTQSSPVDLHSPSHTYTTDRHPSRASFVGSITTFLNDVVVLEDPHVHGTGDRPVSSASITFNMLQTAMGTGVLSLAGVFDYCGAALGSAVVIFFSICTYASVALLLRTVTLLRACDAAAAHDDPNGSPKAESVAVLSVNATGGASPMARETTTLLAKQADGVVRQYRSSKLDPHPETRPLASYENVGERCFGAPGRLVVQIALILMSCVAMTVYLVPLKSFLDLLLQRQAWYREAGGTPNKTLMIVVALVIFPLCMLRRVGKMWVTSLVGVTCISLFVFSSVGLTIDREMHPPSPPLTCHALVHPIYIITNVTETSTVLPDVGGDAAVAAATGAPLAKHDDFAFVKFDGVRFLSTLGIVASSYVCQLTLFPMYDETASAEPAVRATRKVSRCSAVACAVMAAMYLAAAWSGYVTWGSASAKASSILACENPSTPIISVLYVGMTLTAVCAFPLALVSCRQALALLMFGGTNLTTTLVQHTGLTCGIIAAVMSVAVSAGSLTSVLGVGGAVAAPPLVFLLPAACYLRAHAMAEAAGSGHFAVDEEHDDATPLSFHRVLAIAMAAVGLFVQVGSTAGSLMLLL